MPILFPGRGPSLLSESIMPSPLRTTLIHVALLGLAPLAPLAAQGGPPMPQRLADYCEGESCHFGCRAVAQKEIPLRVRDEAGAPVSSRVAPGDTVTVMTGALWVRAPGIVQLRRDTLLDTDDGFPRADTLRLARGDTLHVIVYRELGTWRWWFHGREGEGVEFWNGEAQKYFGRGRENLAAVSHIEPRTEMWLHLEAGAGMSGWWMRTRDHLELIEGEDIYCVH